MPAIFLNISGLLMLAFKDSDIIINAYSYSEILQDLHIVTKMKYPRILKRDVIMLQSHVCPLWHALARTCCTPMCWICVTSIYSAPLKKNIKGPKYWGQVKLLSVVVQWLQQQPTGFSAEGIHQLICQWDIHLTAHGDYFLQPLLTCPVSKWVSFWQASYTPSIFSIFQLTTPKALPLYNCTYSSQKLLNLTTTIIHHGLYISRFLITFPVHNLFHPFFKDTKSSLYTQFINNFFFPLKNHKN